MLEIKLHDIGEGMTEAEVTHFFVKPGDQVVTDQPVVEVQTDKMTAEIPAPQSGIIKELKVKEGSTISIGTTVLVLEVDAYNESAATIELQEEASLLTEHETTPPITDQKNSGSRPLKAAPYTRKVAREQGVNIEDVVGTGIRGRITVEDVIRFAEDENINLPNEVVPMMEHPQVEVALEQETIPFRGRRKQIANKMTQSFFTIPHCTHFEEIDVTRLIEMRSDMKTAGETISATAFFIKAISIALKEFPIFNAKLNEEEEQIQLAREHHIGIAVDTEDGLIVPIIRHVEQKTVRSIHVEMKELIKKAQTNKLSMRELTGGTFTISNVGPLGGSTGATPIINHPEVALMAFHKTKKRPVVVDDEIVIRSIMNISMVFDHRVADGATSVAFTNRVQLLIEKPQLMLIDLV